MVYMIDFSRSVALQQFSIVRIGLTSHELGQDKRTSTPLVHLNSKHSLLRPRAVRPPLSPHRHVLPPSRAVFSLTLARLRPRVPAQARPFPQT